MPKMPKIEKKIAPFDGLHQHGSGLMSRTVEANFWS
jgi:hypothetical protein